MSSKFYSYPKGGSGEFGDSVPYPSFWWGEIGNNGAVGNINDVGDGIGSCFTAQKDMDVSAIAFLTSNIGTGDDFTVRVDTVGAGPVPSGTLVDSAASTTMTVADDDDNTVVIAEFASGFTIPALTSVCVNAVIVNGSASTAFQRTNYGSRLMNVLIYNTTGSWVKDNGGRNLWVAFRDFDGNWSCLPWSWPFLSPGSVTLDSSSSPREVGNRFLAPSYKSRFDGVFLETNPGSGDEFIATLYNDDGQVVSRVETELYDLCGNGGGIVHIPFESVELKPNKFYRVAVMVSAGQIDVNYSENALGEDARSAVPHFGEIVNYCERDTDGAWTDYFERYPFIAPLLAFDSEHGMIL